MKDELDEDIFDLESMPLDRAWNDQPRLYWTYAKKLADAREELERAKAKKEVAYAELDNDVRKKPMAFKVEKVTESSVKNAVLASEHYQHANEVALKAKHKVDVLQAFVEALDQRKKALEARVQLEVHGLYAECKPPKGEEAREKVKDMSIRATNKRCQIK